MLNFRTLADGLGDLYFRGHKAWGITDIGDIGIAPSLILRASSSAMPSLALP